MWRKSLLDSDFTTFMDQLKHVNHLIEAAKRAYFANELNNANTKSVFRTVGTLFNKNTKPRPTCESNLILSNNFSDFFYDKIATIRNNLDNQIDQDDHNHFPIPVIEFSAPALDFEESSEDEIRQIICSSANKSCILDLIPTWLLKATVDSFLPVITHLVNTSICTGTFPDSLKHAIEPSLDNNVLANYRPVSNLPFLSKVIEKVVVSRITSHLDDLNLWESHQSAYRSGHSTETALLAIKNDIMLALSENKGVFPFLLDLSAAFYTLDHHILLQRLIQSIGLSTNAISWFSSYFTNRSCRVSIDGELSRTQSLDYGVPQESAIGPLLFTIYIKPIGDIIRKHGLHFHIYADDTQIYCPFNPKSTDSIQAYTQQVICLHYRFETLDDSK